MTLPAIKTQKIRVPVRYTASYKKPRATNFNSINVRSDFFADLPVIDPKSLNHVASCSFYSLDREKFNIDYLEKDGVLYSKVSAALTLAAVMTTRRQISRNGFHIGIPRDMNPQPCRQYSFSLLENLDDSDPRHMYSTYAWNFDGFIRSDNIVETLEKLDAAMNSAVQSIREYDLDFQDEFGNPRVVDSTKDQAITTYKAIAEQRCFIGTDGYFYAEASMPKWNPSLSYTSMETASIADYARRKKFSKIDTARDGHHHAGIAQNPKKILSWYLAPDRYVNCLPIQGISQFDYLSDKKILDDGEGDFNINAFNYPIPEIGMLRRRNLSWSKQRRYETTEFPVIQYEGCEKDFFEIQDKLEHNLENARTFEDAFLQASVNNRRFYYSELTLMAKNPEDCLVGEISIKDPEFAFNEREQREAFLQDAFAFGMSEFKQENVTRDVLEFTKRILADVDFYAYIHVTGTRKVNFLGAIKPLSRVIAKDKLEGDKVKALLLACAKMFACSRTMKPTDQAFLDLLDFAKSLNPVLKAEDQIDVPDILRKANKDYKQNPFRGKKHNNDASHSDVPENKSSPA